MMDFILFFVVPLVIIFVIIYIFLILPQKRKRKKHMEIVSRVQVGQKIETFGGVVGEVVKVKGETVIIRTGNSEIEMKNFGIASIEGVE